ncbi:MAG: hypothetical protein LUH63_06785 [Parabacteroides sp.]|nr:hypothetical protein [Parabacteroides sp.]
MSDNEEYALWERIAKRNSETDKKKKQRRFIRIAISSAAALLLLLAVGKQVVQRPEKTDTDYQAIIQSNPAPDSASQKVQLVLSNNEKLAIDGTETQLEYKKRGTCKCQFQAG